MIPICRSLHITFLKSTYFNEQYLKRKKKKKLHTTYIVKKQENYDFYAQASHICICSTNIKKDVS